MFERQEILLLRRFAEEKRSKWNYSSELKPGFILACEKRQRSIAKQAFVKSSLDEWFNVTQGQTFATAERWRTATFDKLGIEKGRVVMAVCFPDDRFNREFESQLYNWWATKREFMLGDFECISA